MVAPVVMPIFWSGTSSKFKFCRKIERAITASNKANWSPTHLRGPPLNGMNLLKWLSTIRMCLCTTKISKWWNYIEAITYIITKIWLFTKLIPFLHLFFFKLSPKYLNSQQSLNFIFLLRSMFWQCDYGTRKYMGIILYKMTWILVL